MRATSMRPGRGRRGDGGEKPWDDQVFLFLDDQPGWNGQNLLQPGISE